MYEPGSTKRRLGRTGQRLASVYSQLRNHVFRFAATHLPVRKATAELPGWIWRKPLTWLLKVIARLRMPTRKRHPIVEALQVREQPSPLLPNATLRSISPDKTTPAAPPPQVDAQASQPNKEQRVRPPTASAAQAPPRRLDERLSAPHPAKLTSNGGAAPRIKPRKACQSAQLQPMSPPAPKQKANPQAAPPRTLHKLPATRHDGRSNTPRLIGPSPPPAKKEGETQQANRTVAKVIPIAVRRIATAPLPRRIAIIGDCENDTDSVAASLRFLGLLGKKGKFKAKARGSHIVQTGDLLHKNAPNPEVARFWEGLRTGAEAASCTLHLVAGNHELEIWRRLGSGEGLGLKRRERRSVLDLVRKTKLFHVEGSMLFIHGYPTVKLLRHMQAFRVGTGKRLDDYNQDCFQAAFDDAKLLARYAYLRTNACQRSLLHDVLDPVRYYRRHGREVATLLGTLGIDLVVHGHRPERSGVQRDYELKRWLPGVRMISNDIQLRLQGLGATVIRQVENAPTDLLFVNRKNSTSTHRANARTMLRAPDRPWGPNKERPLGQVSNYVPAKGLTTSAFVTSKQAATK